MKRRRGADTVGIGSVDISCDGATYRRQSRTRPTRTQRRRERRVAGRPRGAGSPSRGRPRTARRGRPPLRTLAAPACTARVGTSAAAAAAAAAGGVATAGPAVAGCCQASALSAARFQGRAAAGRAAVGAGGAATVTDFPSKMVRSSPPPRRSFALHCHARGRTPSPPRLTTAKALAGRRTAVRTGPPHKRGRRWRRRRREAGWSFAQRRKRDWRRDRPRRRGSWCARRRQRGWR